MGGEETWSTQLAHVLKIKTEEIIVGPHGAQNVAHCHFLEGCDEINPGTCHLAPAVK